ncbi:MAG: GGDEF domain-containing protein, partial [Methylocystaceae bacterium]
PIIDRHIKDLLGALLVIQDLRLVNELLSKNQELHEKSIRDSLTDLYNHQYIISKLENEIDGTFDSGKHLALMMLDIDNFKMINDIYGHQFGDSVLVIVAKILTDIVQTSGYVGRYGGEEFTIILPQTSIEEASILGNRICTDVKNYGFPNNCCITISIGIKLLDEENSTTLIKNADQLLYLAKANGRNRVELS